MIDPNQLERLVAIAGGIPISAYPGKSSDERSHNAVALVDTLIDLLKALRTSQLVPAQQTSGDVVEAVARAIRRAEIGGFSDEEVAQAVVDGSWEHKQPAALAAITAYEALRAKEAGDAP